MWKLILFVTFMQTHVYGGVQIEDLKRKIRSTAVNGDSFFGVNEIKLLKDSEQQQILQDEFMMIFFKRFNATQFESTAEAKDHFVKGLIEIYQEYWWNALLRKEKIEKLDDRLMKKLRQHFKVTESNTDEEFGKIYDETLKHKGIHAISGKTLPLFEFLAWTKEEEKTYEIQLLGAVEKVKVVFISDYVSKGWGFYATGGKSGTGGWATKEKLFCLKDSYQDLDSESFVYSYLKHEAQHFRDYKEYPWIEGVDLEYRAKLTEIAFSQKELYELLKYFASSEPKDLSASHAVANKILIHNLLKKMNLGHDISKIFAMNVKSINDMAKLLFDEHTQTLRSPKAKTLKLQPIADQFKKDFL